MRRTFFALSLTFTLLVPTLVLGQTVRITPAERAMADAITASQLSNYLHFVASDAMGGRDTPSQGLDIMAEFLKMKLDRWKFKPAGDNGTFFQKMALRRETADHRRTGLKIGEQAFAFGDDVFRLQGDGEVSGQIVFGKDGWMVKGKGIDSFAGVDVRGKIVAIAGSRYVQNTITPRPEGVTQADLAGVKGTDWADPVEHARSKGAAGLIVIAPPQIQNTWSEARSFLSRGRLFPERLREATAPSPFPVILVSRKAGDAVFAGEPSNAASATAFTTGKSATVSAFSSTETLTTQNVVALWEGSDPVLKAEMVAVGAHYDHVGTNPNVPGDDKIFNGADDDGSGTVAVLAIAEALAKARTRPKRSILLVWHAGEEKGLWGAEYFNKFPTVDIKKVIAQLNIDMIGRSRKPGDTNPRNRDLTDANSVYVIGSEMMSSTLGAITKQTNNAYLKLTYDYRYDDPKDTNRFFFRSDHFHYATNGIPVVFWFSGVHEDYHGPADHADKIDYQKMEKIARTIFLTMLKLSDLRERPAVDKQLPPELTQR